MSRTAGLPDYVAAFNAAPGKYLLLYPDLRIAGVTDSYLGATMTVRESIVGRHLFDVFPDNPGDPAADGVRNLHASLGRVLTTRKPDRMAVQKYDIRRPEATGGGFEERFWSPLNTPVLSRDGEVELIIHWVEDVTEIVRLKRELRQQREAQAEERRVRGTEADDENQPFLHAEAFDANRRLAESERRYRFMADSVPQLIWTADHEGQLDYCNERFIAYTGRTLDELRGDGWHDIVQPDDRVRTIADWSAACAAGSRFQVEHRVVSHDGSARWMLSLAVPYRHATGSVMQWFGSTTDIHERVQAEEKLRAAQRLQAVGTLAGGMAHEVNNMMSAVVGFGELVLLAFGPEHPQRHDVEEMMKAGTRASEVTRQVLAFSRQQVLKPTVLDASDVVNELAAVLRRLVGSDRRLDIRLSTASLRVLADRSQLEQVLINLAANARDATRTNGVIAIETEPVTLNADILHAHREDATPPGRYLRLTVRDDGGGMPADVVARAFEPFFTTKPVGQGTGLGLSMVYGIAKQSGGYAHIDSAPGAGATVSVYLPTVDTPVTPLELTQDVAQGRGERILVVEDEAMVRSLARRGLEAAGFDVYQAPNGAAALQFLSTTAERVDLVLTDIVMPNMNGRQLADAIAERFPDLPVVFMSGYSGEEISRRGLTVGDAPLIHKPFSLKTLTDGVRRVLDGRVSL